MTASRPPSPAPSSSPWTLDEFVEHLNAQVPLDSAQDARRAQAWNPRLVRHYTTSKALSAPEKLGRQAFYGPQHLDEARRLTSLQDAGVSARSVARLTASTEAPAPSTLNVPPSSRPEGDPRRRALDLLSGWQAPSSTRGPSPVMLAQAASVPRASPGLVSFANESLDQAFQSTPPEVFFSTTAQGDVTANAAVPTGTGEQWHRWSPMPGLDVALREDLWGREDELRQLLARWAQPR